MLINDLEYFERSCNYNGKTSGMDHPGHCHLGKHFWQSYEIQEFNYKYNSWGFRGPEYDEFIGKPVNICLGDSFTVNIGGPIEHSWSSQLAEKFDIPTLNLGMDGAGNDAIRLVYKRACEVFDVQNTFVMYSFLHRRLEDKKFTLLEYTLAATGDDFSKNVEYFSQQRIPGVYEAALPTWCWTEQEFLLFANKFKIYMFDYPNSTLYSTHKHQVDQNRPLCVSKNKYNSLRGSDWPTFKNFINGADPCPEMLTEEFGNFVKKHLLYVNRDGYHMNNEANKKYAEYFYKQWKQKNES